MNLPVERRRIGLPPLALVTLVGASTFAFACGSDKGATPTESGLEAGTPYADSGSSTTNTPDGGPPIDDSPPPTCPPGNTGPGSGPDGTVPGALTFPSPTIHNVAVAWAITGDANADGVVKIRYRKQGEAGWHRAMPLRRVPAGSNGSFSWENRHAGSIFDLDAATTYEIEAFLLDPSGGCELRNATVATRPIPAPMAGAPVKQATSTTFATVSAASQPGDIVELAAGTYTGLSIAKDGEPGKPIVYRAAGAVTINGDVSLIQRKHVHLVGMTINGRVRINATTDVAIMKNTITTTSDGIVAALRSEDDYIADNTITGATQWNEGALGVDGNNVGEGIQVTGPGHVIEHNRVTGFRDGISFFEDGEAVDQYSLDVVENDVRNSADDGMEADFCFHDCRIVRNRFTNSFMAMSSQPSLGGPTYFIRNTAYNVVLSTFKLQRGSVGDVVLHNTSVKNGDALGVYTEDVFARQYFRNNLFVGGPGGTFNGYNTGTGRVAQLAAAAPSGDYDYDAFGSTTGAFSGRIGSTTFASLAELKAGTTEKHALQVGLDAFAQTITFPANPFPARDAADLRPKAAAATEDAALVIDNVSDVFVGNGPDIGAHEGAGALPAYGPR